MRRLEKAAEGNQSAEVQTGFSLLGSGPAIL